MGTDRLKKIQRFNRLMMMLDKEQKKKEEKEKQVSLWDFEAQHKQNQESSLWKWFI